MFFIAQCQIKWGKQLNKGVNKLVNEMLIAKWNPERVLLVNYELWE